MASSSIYSPAPRVVGPVPGEALLHPLALFSLGLLVVNDALLKHRYGSEPYFGIMTGKASDVAGMVFFPLVLVSIVEAVRRVLGRGRSSRRGRSARDDEWASPWVFSHRELVGAVLLTGLGFFAVQSVPVAGEAYAWAVAAIRWLPQGLAAMLTGGTAPILQPVHHVRDLSDNLCLPALWWSYTAGRGVRA